jgi:hypothetical protein
MGFAALYPFYGIIPFNGKRQRLAAMDAMRHDRAESFQSRRQCGA